MDILKVIGLTLGLATAFRLLWAQSFWLKVIGFAVLGHIINLLLIFSGQNFQNFKKGRAPIIGNASFESLSDPLPQALILTAIVISFALSAWMILYYLKEKKIS